MYLNGMQTGLRTRHVTTACRNLTHPAILHADNFNERSEVGSSDEKQKRVI